MMDEDLPPLMMKGWLLILELMFHYLGIISISSIKKNNDNFTCVVSVWGIYFHKQDFEEMLN